MRHSNRFPSPSPSSKSQYHRHCTSCGWGYHKAQWTASVYCTKCGDKLRRDSTPQQSASVAFGKAVAYNPNTPASLKKSIHTKTTEVVTWISSHPIMASTCLLTVGYGAAVTGGFLVPAGAALALLGHTTVGTASTIGVITALFGLLGNSPQATVAGLGIAAAGALAGALLTIMGTILSAAGAFLAAAGLASICAGLLIVVTRVGCIAWKHRKAIRAIARDIRTKFSQLPQPKKQSKSIDSPKWDIDSLLKQVDHELLRSRHSNLN